jgi:hypothetical protein
MKSRLIFGAILEHMANGADRFFGALELVTSQGTAISATISALAASAGDSLAVRNMGDNTKPARILQMWTDVQVAGTVRIRSPKFHDNVQGIRFDTLVSDPRPLLPWGVPALVYGGDVITAEMAGSAVAGDIEYLCMLLYYENLPGVNVTFLTPEQVRARMVNLFTVENTLALGTGGGYSGGEAINAEFDQWHAGSEYALIGYTVDGECAAIGWRGGDTGNLRVGGPGDETERELTSDWFFRLSREFAMPLVPVFRADNKAGITIDGVQDENGTDVTVNSIFAELKK